MKQLIKLNMKYMIQMGKIRFKFMFKDEYYFRIAFKFFK